MLFASARLAPPGGHLSTYDRDALATVPGVRHIAARDAWIAVVAETWWAAERALKAANPVFSGQKTPANPRPLFEQALVDGDEQQWFGRGD
jgi:isoquinoline 1-oxidoreductase beta subunit